MRLVGSKHFKMRNKTPKLISTTFFQCSSTTTSTYLIALSLLWYLLIQGKIDKWCAKSVKCQHSVWKFGSFHLNDSDLFKVSTHSSASLVVIFSLVSSEILTRDLELWMYKLYYHKVLNWNCNYNFRSLWWISQ